MSSRAADAPTRSLYREPSCQVEIRVECRVSGETRIVTVQNSQGFHMRPVMRFVDLASRFQSEILVKKKDQVVNGKDPMEMILLEATRGTVLELQAEGPDVAPALNALAELVASGFGET